MARIASIDPAKATGKSKELLDAVQGKLGMTPNMMKVMAASPSVLESYLSFSGALGHGALPAKIREQIALGTAQANECEYCMAAHTALGRVAGLDAAQMNEARRFGGSDPKAAAALAFGRAVLSKQGAVSDADFAAVRSAGFNDAQIAEIIAGVALSWFTNAFNKAAKTEVDFPKVELGAPIK